MKKIYTLLLATLGLSVAAMAQREIDLSITMTAPGSGTTFQSGSSLDIQTVIQNNGPDTLRGTDSVFVQYYVSGNLITFNLSGSQVTTFYFTTRHASPGDTLHFSPNFPNLTFPDVLNGTHEFCALVVPVNRTADSIVDRTAANNMGCNTITFAGGTPSSSIGNIYEWTSGSASVVSSVYPNPAVTSATFALNLVGNQEVAVKIVDLAGRVVLSENKGTLVKGENKVTVNTTGLTPGLYLYQVTMGNHTATGKLNVTK